MLYPVRKFNGLVILLKVLSVLAGITGLRQGDDQE